MLAKDLDAFELSKYLILTESSSQIISRNIQSNSSVRAPLTQHLICRIVGTFLFLYFRTIVWIAFCCYRRTVTHQMARFASHRFSRHTPRSFVQQLILHLLKIFEDQVLNHLQLFLTFQCAVQQKCSIVDVAVSLTYVTISFIYADCPSCLCALLNFSYKAKWCCFSQLEVVG